MKTPITKKEIRRANLPARISNQIRARIKEDIADYTIAPGAQLESVMDYFNFMATTFNVSIINIMTIAKPAFKLNRIGALWFRGNELIYNENK